MYFVIILILIFVIYSSFNLSLKDYKVKDVCPKVFGIPACYLVFIFFVAALLAHLIIEGIPYYYYYGFLALPFLLAFAGSATELSGRKICPRTPGGTPMCYLSLGFCTALIVLKIFS